MNAPADFPTVSCDRKFETRVSSMIMAMTPAGFWSMLIGAAKAAASRSPLGCVVSVAQWKEDVPGND